MDSGQKRLSEFLTKKAFHVPDYQRYYSWEDEQLDDLWTDLRTAGNKDHYFGTFIVQETDREEIPEGLLGKQGSNGTEHGYDVHLLIDGQQRLTTLTILLRAMCDALTNAADDHPQEDEVKNEAAEIEREFLVHRGVYPLILLDEDGTFLKNHIIDGMIATANPDTPSQRRLWSTKQYFDRKFDELHEECGNAEDFIVECLGLRNTIENLELMVYSIAVDSPERATLIFESVNDRGLHLSTLDKTKSFLMHMTYLSSDEENDDLQNTIQWIQESFGNIYKYYQTISDSEHGENIDDDDVQRYHYIQFANWTDNDEHLSSNLLDTLKRDIRNLHQKNPEACITFIEAYVESLEAAFLTLKRILTYNDNSTVETLLDRIHRLRHATKFYPLLIAAWPTLDSIEDRRILCKAIETVIFRVYSIGNHPNYTGRSALFHHARDTSGDNAPDLHRLADGSDVNNDLEPSSLSHHIIHLTEIMNRFEGDDTFRRTLRSTNMYSKAASMDLRYMFCVYSERRAEDEREPLPHYLKKLMGSDYTIEHIWPQTPKDGEYPLEDAGEYSSIKERYEAYVDRFGNLSIASQPWNSKYGNDNYEDKKDKYKDSTLWVQKDVGKRYDEWSVKNIEHREDELIKFIIDEWPTPDLMVTHDVLDEW